MFNTSVTKKKNNLNKIIKNLNSVTFNFAIEGLSGKGKNFYLIVMRKQNILKMQKQLTQKKQIGLNYMRNLKMKFEKINLILFMSIITNILFKLDIKIMYIFVRPQMRLDEFNLKNAITNIIYFYKKKKLIEFLKVNLILIFFILLLIY